MVSFLAICWSSMPCGFFAESRQSCLRGGLGVTLKAAWWREGWESAAKSR